VIPQDATTKNLVSSLRGSPTDLKRVVEKVAGRGLTRVVVSARAVRAWEARDARAWALVTDWLAARGATLVETPS